MLISFRGLEVGFVISRQGGPYGLISTSGQIGQLKGAPTLLIFPAQVPCYLRPALTFTSRDGLVVEDFLYPSGLTARG